ncbi:hypothetical protein D8674_000438 [Pyrus ussuriensis x Pyrus communis]|uniref:Uncharacterized protein n=1 Tax=Pyrus ussuriensis x Pyrus communis TaxID=2448454 RepID=A0A5N5F362_9ROSA|nr:hypothetical protein D8674_000438 [Pyrus ussuriensis x Pyrus communis]
MVRIWALEDSRRRSMLTQEVAVAAMFGCRGGKSISQTQRALRFFPAPPSATYTALPLLVDCQSHSSPDPPPLPLKYNETKCLVFCTKSSFSSSAPSLL